MIILGIDPGITGAMALYDDSADMVLGCWDLPVKEREYGGGNQLDAVVLYENILTILPDEAIAVVEQVGSMPKQGVVSSFNFGHTVGTIYGVLSALGVERFNMHPAVWKKKFGLIGSNKGKVIEMVKDAYPETGQWLKLKKHHNRAEAIAISISGKGLK